MSSASRWTGTHVALVTPFRGGRVDEEALRRLVRYVLDGGVNGLVPCGTTGEAATLTEVEFRQVVGAVLDEAGGRASVVAGTGTNDTASTIRRTQLAAELGVDGALVVTPYYNKPSQSGLLAHYRAVARGAAELPIILYNVPGRTGVNMLPDTVAQLAELPNVVAIKEACGDLGQVQRLLARLPERVAVLSGDDALALPMYVLGARGVISVAGNVAPREMSELWRAVTRGALAEATALQRALFPLFEALFLESNPAPCKAALAQLGWMRDEVRLPLVPAGDATRAALAAASSHLAGQTLRPALAALAAH